MVLNTFHPAVAAWFRNSFDAPTEPQIQAWPAIAAGRNVLIAAPTGSGKTLAAFLAVIDGLVRRGVEQDLPDETCVVYVSPLKALSNDIQRNLERPLAGIREELSKLGLPDVAIRTFVRTGDTPQAERERMRRRPPHIVVTTPESLYILLTAVSGRKMLATVRTVIVDEIHALAPNKRGSHLALSLERLEALTGVKLTRIGLSATQKPIEEVARFLVGGGADCGADPNFSGIPSGTSCSNDQAPIDCIIIDTGHVRVRDLAIELPSSPLEAVMSGEVWKEVYDRIAELVLQHRTTLVFVNTRRMAERAARHLSERLGEPHVAAHHGSLAREQRLDAEQRLKRGELKALVATASLELGIDIGDVDLVCQLGSPRSISAFLQRVGRSGHSVGGTPKGRLFALSRDELVECAALLDAVRRAELDRLRIPQQPFDVLAQQLVAEVACRDCGEDELFALVRRAYPYRNLTAQEFKTLLQMLADGYDTRRGRRNAYLHRDTVNRRVRGRRGARLTAITCGGAIPDNADYQVILEPDRQFVGTLNEDFAVESMAGDIFQLGNTSYRILRVEAGRVRVEDARGQPPTIPFWLGEGLGRSDELSFAVSRLRESLAAALTPDSHDQSAALQWLHDHVCEDEPVTSQIIDYLAAANAALGLLPTQSTIVIERFFDEAGGMQLVIHSPYGSRVNRAWGLALRKRFCRKFNFELQAAATEDNIILSLTTVHSFQLDEVVRYLHSNSVRDVLVQALLDAPMFTTRWRWNAMTALALTRFRGGKKTPAQLQRMNAEDLIATLFPDQLACAENLQGAREVPDHPLVKQTIDDCLHEAMDIDGLETLLRKLESGDVRVVTRELTEPSPLALEILTARPYAYLDDAPLEERRTQAVMSRRWLDPETAADLGKLDMEAIRRVREEAWPEARNADELHDALVWLGFLTDSEITEQPGWDDFLSILVYERRVGCYHLCPPSSSLERSTLTDHALWVAAERLPEFMALFPDSRLEPDIATPEEFGEKVWIAEDALVEVVRGRLEGLGPVTVPTLAAPLGLPHSRIEGALAKLQAEGFVMSGRFTPGDKQSEWCERRLLARIHRYTVNRLRQEIEPVASRDFLRFLFDWQHVSFEERVEGPDAVALIISQLEGYEAPAAAWETEILPARVSGYEPNWLDDLCLAGRVVWTRLTALKSNPERERNASPVRTTPIALLTRRHARLWTRLVSEPSTQALSSRGRAVADYLARRGASFFDEIADGARLLRTEVEEALAELVALGLINSDSFSGLRALLVPSERRPSLHGGRRRRAAMFGIEDAGRWTLLRRSPSGLDGGEDLSPAHAVSRKLPTRITPSAEVIEHIARTLLRRYGVVFWRLLEREAAWLPPWRDLLRVYRRLEARGEIRGGRFVAGFSGEQFALPDAVESLRKIRRREHDGKLIAVSGADPLNLAGIITLGAKIPALTTHRVLYRDGVPVAALIAGEVRFLETLNPKDEWELQHTLLKRQVPALLNYLR